jgi:DNA processing protein
MIKLQAQSQPNFFWFNQFLHKKIEQYYLQGDKQILLSSQPKVAIVGSRCMTNYGHTILRQIVPALARQNITIVSGGAFGVDLEAQKLALEYDAKVITILGSGLHNPAPKTNSKFFEQVAKRGVLVSQYEPDYPATRYTFPERNRLISAMSDLILIIEAQSKSGALITADFALQQGKPIACFPGRITDELSAGTNKLIQQGAHPILNTQDIFELLGITQKQVTNPVQQTLQELYS